MRVQGLLAWEERAPTDGKCRGVRIGEGIILGDFRWRQGLREA